jgi:2-amino-4-hydroxy-6-hydroxymethyldihydropteridine diphosphokinase
MLQSHPQIKLLSTSSFYETEPVGFADQDWFVNAVVAVETDLTPNVLLELCQRIEEQLKRVRLVDNKNGPRTIDVDILFYDTLVMNTPDLVIPHPGFHERAYTLVPFLEINSRFLHPVLQKSVEQLHHDLAEPEEVMLYGTRGLF